MSLNDLVQYGQKNAPRSEIEQDVLQRVSELEWMPEPGLIVRSDDNFGSYFTLVDDDSILVMESYDSLDTQEADAIAGRIGTGGIDALALYIPFHSGLKRWGVYLSLSGIRYLTGVLQSGVSVKNRDPNIARNLVVAHECFHARTEFAATYLEIVRREDIYGQYCRWTEHMQQRTPEESGGNVAGLRTIKKNVQVSNRAEQFFDSQPEEYTHWRDYRRSIPKAMREIAELMMPGRKVTSDTKEHGLWPNDNDELRRAVPIYLVDEPGKYSGITVAKQFPKDFGIKVDAHTREHPPPHFHLQYPIGEPYGCYGWKDLTPVKLGDPILSSSLRKRLDKYFGKYGSAIDKKILKQLGVKRA